MGLEDPTYISDLNSSWPLGTDKRREGDNHIRNIKLALKNTFPNINAPVTATPLQLNQLPPTGFTAWFAELLKHLVPIGTIVAWGGSDLAIPQGWSLCDGSNIVGYGVVPDLRDRFIIGGGAGGSYPVGQVGGELVWNTSEFEHPNEFATPTTLTMEQLPPASLPIPANARWSDANGSNVGITGGPQCGNRNNADLAVNFPGGGQPHDHLVIGWTHSHTVQLIPPYYALAYICKTTQFVLPV